MSWMTSLCHRLLPCPCLLCESVLPVHARSLLCPSCQLALPLLEPSHICHCCSLPLNHRSRFCADCITQPPHFERSIIPFHYSFPLDYLVRRFKYQHSLSAGSCLTQLLEKNLITRLHNEPPLRPDLLVPAPLHWRKLWQRGFNQAAFTAQALSKALAIPLLAACARHSDSHSQQGLARRDRLRNLRRAFCVEASAQEAIRHKHIALVDDVVTTTATARSLSEILIKAGARRVDIWAIARTPAPNDVQRL